MMESIQQTEQEIREIQETTGASLGEILQKAKELRESECQTN